MWATTLASVFILGWHHEKFGRIRLLIEEPIDRSHRPVREHLEAAPQEIVHGWGSNWHATRKKFAVGARVGELGKINGQKSAMAGAGWEEDMRELSFFPWREMRRDRRRLGF